MMINIKVRDQKQEERVIELHKDDLTERNLDYLRTIIAAEFELSDPERVKMVCRGKVLKDSSKTLSDYKIGDNTVIMFILTKAPPISNLSTEKINNQPSEGEGEALIKELMEITQKDYNQVKLVLEFCKNNRDEALMVLEGRLPNGQENPLATLTSDYLEHLEDDAYEEAIDMGVDFLLSDPSFRPARQMIYEDPTTVMGLLDQLMAIYPGFVLALKQDPSNIDELVEEIMEGGPNGGENWEEMEEILSEEELQEEEEAWEDIVEDLTEDTPKFEDLSEEEQGQVKQIVEYGYVLEEALEAFIVSDKDLQKAVNYLMDKKQQESEDSEDGDDDSDDDE